MLGKVKYKLFFSFLLFSSFSIITIIISIWYYQQKNTISKIKLQLNSIYNLTLKDFKTQQEFLSYETINPKFFITGESKIVEQHNKLSNEIVKSLIQLKAINYGTHSKLIDFTNKLKNEVDNYNNTFQKIVAEILKRGFKDYGIEGTMRTYAHALMEIKELDQIKILMLRRHEKDFIIRKENQYILKFETLINKVREDVKKNRTISNLRRNEIATIVDNYEKSFLKLTVSEKKLGLKVQSGLMLQLSQNIDRIENLIIEQEKTISLKEASVFKKLLLTTLSVITGLIILMFVLSYFAASALTNPIVKLNNYIEDYVSSNFTYHPQIQQKISKDEIGLLVTNFQEMANEINSYINQFKEKVEERTAEINMQKIEINEQNKKITLQRDELITKTELLELQQKIVNEQIKSILDSIRYAERIQKTILPPFEIIQQELGDCFIYYQPKDIVSGDFYWLHTESDDILLAAVDCTGHGVPGAFMSIIGFNCLNKIVQEQKETQPDIILNELDKEIKKILRHNINNNVKDGMDIALCSINKQTNILSFAGANNSLYLIRNNELREMKGDKNAIGSHSDDLNSKYVYMRYQIQLQKGDMIYVFSDGYIDQFGGSKMKKFKRAPFRELLLSIHQKSTSTQKEILKTTLEEWMGNHYQVDDVLVIGIKI